MSFLPGNLICPNVSAVHFRTQLLGAENKLNLFFGCGNERGTSPVLRTTFLFLILYTIKTAFNLLEMDEFRFEAKSEKKKKCQ